MSNKRGGLDTFLNQLPSKGRFRFFLLFVLLSFTFWTSTKLSKSYQVEQSFPIRWTDLPVGIILTDTPQKINLSLSASGIEILFYRMTNKKITASLKQIDFSSDNVLVNLNSQTFQIEQQLFEDSVLNQINPSQLYVNFSRLDQKLLAVAPQTEIELRAGYLSDSPLKTIPDSINVRGPKALLDSINSIETQFFQAIDVNESVDAEVVLQSTPGLQFSVDKVRLSLPVSRYSEKEFNLMIEVINVPLGERVKLFPPNAKVRATLPLTLLGTVKASDFSLVVDYQTIVSSKEKQLELKMVGQPPAVKKLVWEPKYVNYLLRK
jgi:hypothetical protein